ncbi:hypothetical protein [Streptomyces sp. NBC_01304]|uniref:hypothetical protein n=1 Tax=Streptomyces sp. NBC_01304 TaxID=2903818 RepID=UPI002E138B05|nr:hypothetical protein OG430_47710 [Streptomyces sp. NBC_01304]
MDLQQIDGLAVDPGFRLNLDGKARFQHEGYIVDVLVRRPTVEEFREGFESDEVVVIGTVTLEKIEVGKDRSVANEYDGGELREALESVLQRAVADARHTVARLAARVDTTDSKSRPA